MTAPTTATTTATVLENLFQLYGKASNRLLTIKFAIEYGVCARCALFLARDQSNLNAMSIGDLNKVIRHAFETVFPTCTLRNLDETCTLCFGLFQETHETLRAQFSAAAAACEFVGMTTFHVSSTLPSAMYVRNELVLAELKQFTDENNIQWSRPPADLDLKERLRYFVAEAVQPLGINHSKASLLDLRIAVTHEASDREYVALESHARCRGKLRIAQKKRTRRRPTLGQARPHAHSALETTGGVVIESLVRALHALGSEILSLQALRRPSSAAQRVVVRCSLVHASLWIGGRYNKYARNVSQSRWLSGGTHVGATSVEQCMQSTLNELFGASGAVFRSAGREDIDVRMLGNGRPFMFELLTPRRLNVGALDLVAAQRAINVIGANSVRVRALQLLPQSACRLLLDGSEHKRKTYRCLVQLATPAQQQRLDALAAMRDLKISQLTPLRVAHRRAQLVRERCIHRVEAQQLKDCWYAVTLTTSAGAYVKEFVHGDFGRTKPSLATLLDVAHATVAQLDVLDVGLQFPIGDTTINALVEPPPPQVPLFDEVVALRPDADDDE